MIILEDKMEISGISVCKACGILLSTKVITPPLEEVINDDYSFSREASFDDENWYITVECPACKTPAIQVLLDL